MLESESETGLFIFGEELKRWRIRAVAQVSYEVHINSDVFSPPNTVLVGPPEERESRRRCVVIDRKVDCLHGHRIRRYFDHHGVEVHMCVVDVDETRKDFDTAARITRAIDAFGIDRKREPIIAIGGGVLLDVAGLVAGLYRRGTPIIKVPTTLIGLVDAGIGVKTGINFNGHKNRLGTYSAPSITFLDRSFLRTLDSRHISNGLAEILKIALIKDADLFDLLEVYGAELLDQKFQDGEGYISQVGGEVLNRSIHGMLEELQPNLWETKLERVVDYGHTFSPTIEMHALPALLHGEAVCVDMALTTVLAWQRGLLTACQRDRVLAAMRSLNLPIWHDLLEPSLLGKALADTVRHRNGMQRLPLPVGIGRATFVNNITVDELALAVHELRRFSHAWECSHA